MNATEYGPLILEVLGGVGALLVGIGILVAGLAAARTLNRLQTTLDEVDQQVRQIGPPLSSTLANVDQVTGSIGTTADSLSKTVGLTRSAVTPAIVNLGATMGGVTAGLRRLVTGKDSSTKE